MIVDRAIALLSAGGIRADAALPAERITRVTEPVAAVSLYNADMDKCTATVMVEILSPVSGGGYLCQKKALEACAILEAAGAVCSQKGCEFLPKANMFRVPVMAAFHGIARADNMESPPGFTLIAGTETLTHVCGFSARQVRTNSENSMANTPWEFTVEEFFPWGTQDTIEAEEPFVLDLNYMGIIERFADCTWTQRKRIVEAKGIRQIRTGQAARRIITA